MSDFAIGPLSFPVLLGLIFVRVPIGLAMFTVGFSGLVFVNGDAFIAVARLESKTYTTSQATHPRSSRCSCSWVISPPWAG